MSAASASYNSRRHAGLGIRSLWAHSVLVLGAFLCMLLCFPNPGWSVLAYVALVPLTLVGMRSTRRRTLLLTTYLGGVLWWLLMVYWLSRVTVGGYVVLSFYLGLYWPVYAVLIRLMDQRTRWPKCLSVPCVWASLEYIRCHVLAGGFGWFNLGHSQAPYHPLHGPGQIVQIADIFGEWGVSFVVAMTSGMIVDMLTRPWSKSSNRWYRFSPAMRSVLLWMLLIISTLFYGAYRIRTTPQNGDTVKVSVIQTNVPQSNKTATDMQTLVDDWERALTLTVKASASDSPDVIVWPETMSPAAFNAQALEYYRDAPTAEKGYESFYYQTESLASKLKVDLFAGAHAKFDWQIVDLDDGRQFVVPMRRYNSVYHFPPHVGQSVARYDKIHLVPFGEFIPWVSSVPMLKNLFMNYLSPHKIDYSLSHGQEKVIFNVTANERDVRIASPICFEDTISRLVRSMVYDGKGQKRVDVLINLTNDGWYDGSVQAYVHTQNAVLRCIENRVPMARSVNTGISGFIDSSGELGNWVQEDGRFQQIQGWATRTMILDNRQTFYGRWGDWPIRVILILTMLRLFVATLVRRKMV